MTGQDKKCCGKCKAFAETLHDGCHPVGGGFERPDGFGHGYGGDQMVAEAERRGLFG